MGVKRKVKPHSIVKKMMIQMTLILVILLSTLILSNLYSLKVVRSHVVESSENTLAVYINSIQNRLESTSKDLLEVFDENIDSMVSLSKADENRRVLESIRLQGELSSKLSNREAADGLFIRSTENKFFLATYSNRVQSREALRVSSYLEDMGERQQIVTESDEWSAVQWGDHFYLIKVIDYSGVVFGTFVKTDTLLSPFKKSSNDGDFYMLRDHKEQLLATTSPAALRLDEEDSSEPPKYIYVSKVIPEFGEMTNAVVSRNVFSGLGVIQWIIAALSVTLLIILPIMFRMFARDMIGPILELVKGTKEIEKGNWDYRLTEKSTSIEFSKLYNAFTSMIREIKELKIKTYEEQLERSKTELKYLQMQIRPHFFLNAITTISSLTYHNKNEDIRRLIGHLSTHLRYMFKAGWVQVPIAEEMKHVENYIRMQEIRYPDQVFYMTETDPALLGDTLPQYLIQTFVENAFKHALTHDDMLSLFIKVEERVLEGREWIRILVEDNGTGFPEEVIHELNGLEPKQSHSGDKVGISNIQRTLALLYKQDGLLRLSNNEPTGAKVEILIPRENAD